MQGQYLLMSEVFSYFDNENRNVLEVFVKSLFTHIAWLQVRESYGGVLTVLIHCAA